MNLKLSKEKIQKLNSVLNTVTEKFNLKSEELNFSMAGGCPCGGTCAGECTSCEGGCSGSFTIG